jgi:exodeoxyribonuclease III
LKILSFNVNGIRACVKKSLIDDLRTIDADVICLQETKATPEQVREALTPLEGYHIEAYGAEKRGYSGTAVLSKKEALNVSRGIGVEAHDQEGRVITTEWPSFYIINVYVPNASSGLKRLPYRTQLWDVDFLRYLKKLEHHKPVVLCGDLNVCHRPIDIKNAKSNYNKSPGYTQAEIDGMDRMIQSGFIDTFRSLHPDEVKYSWWSYRSNARPRNIGWRLDYFLVSQSLTSRVKSSEIYNDINGSDHCPVALEIH